jgi:hypothetical protein
LTGLFQLRHTETMEETKEETGVKAPEPSQLGTLAQEGTPSQYTSQTSGRVTKINWGEAKEYYLSDPQVTLQKVADKFGITYKSVQKWAAKEKWIGQRKDKATEDNLELRNKHREETVDEINSRHIDLYLQMQGFIKTNIAVAQNYVREKYLESERSGEATDKKMMFSAQNVKYLMEALKIAVDGERVAEGISITGPTKSERDIKVSGAIGKYEPKQMEAMFAEARSIVGEMQEVPERNIIEGDVSDG